MLLQKSIFINTDSESKTVTADALELLTQTNVSKRSVRIFLYFLKYLL